MNTKDYLYILSASAFVGALVALVSSLLGFGE